MNYPAAELRSIKRHFHFTPMQSIEEFFGLNHKSSPEPVSFHCSQLYGAEYKEAISENRPK